MLIKSLKVIANNDIYSYTFSSKTHIHSNENSKGKTTLVRFILYALGYQIPATEGIGNFDKFIFELTIESEGEVLKINRKENSCNVLTDAQTNEFQLPEQENELHARIFKINNITVLNNLLAVYYIDQEKGWTLLNRGKIIGNIRFNIENFISGISEIDINDLLIERSVITEELKKYRYFKNVIDIREEYIDEEYKLPNQKSDSMDELLKEQREIDINLNKVKRKRKEIDEIIRTNKGFAEMISNYGLRVKYKNEEFLLTTEMLADFKENQDVLKEQEKTYKLEEDKLTDARNKNIYEINQKNALFSMDSILDNMEKVVGNIEIDSSQVEKIIRQLSNKRNSINEEIKSKLMFNNDQLYKFYQTIIKYADELGIRQFISKDSPRYVLTNKLKGLSGRVMSQMAFIFKLSYLKAIKDKFGIILPIIIDSPRTNELSENSTNSMMALLNRDFEDHQIIIASIYPSTINNINVINMNNGLFSDIFKENQNTNV